MSCGKYSPTVSRWYMIDQDWHDKHCEPGEWIDRDGYDSYGYHHETELDRAGYTELDYLQSGQLIDDEYSYPLYEDVFFEWCKKPLPSQKSD
jgi:hypothetical protein